MKSVLKRLHTVSVEPGAASFLRNEPGWVGAFTRERAKGAWPSGTAIVKRNSEERDLQPDGTLGVVLGSISHPDIRNGEVCYFVEWATAPRVAVAVMAFKLRKANT